MSCVQVVAEQWGAATQAPLAGDWQLLNGSRKCDDEWGCRDGPLPGSARYHHGKLVYFRILLLLKLLFLHVCARVCAKPKIDPTVIKDAFVCVLTVLKPEDSTASCLCFGTQVSLLFPFHASLIWSATGRPSLTSDPPTQTRHFHKHSLCISVDWCPHSKTRRKKLPTLRFNLVRMLL